jgi:hypothetical protein
VLLGSFAASYAREIANEENLPNLIDPEMSSKFSPDLRKIVGLDHGVKPDSKWIPPWRKLT